MAKKGFDPEYWLKQRVMIFQKYCFPSVINQSNLNFTWLIYIDSETSLEVMASLRNMLDRFPFVMIIQRKFAHFSLKFVINEDVKRNFNNDFQYLISSRLDTDDMLNVDFVKEIQSRFNHQVYTAVNFNKGLIYDVETGICSSANHQNNPFMSLIEKRTESGFKTVFHRMHYEYSDEPNKIEVKNSIPMWCMCVHGLNVSTSFYGRIMKLQQPDLKGLFGFEFQKKPNLFSIVRFSLRSYIRKWKKVKRKLESIIRINLEKQ